MIQPCPPIPTFIVCSSPDHFPKKTQETLPNPFLENEHFMDVMKTVK